MNERWGRRQVGGGGFTLVELLVVLLIITILAAIAIPLFLRQRDKGYVSQVQSALANAKIFAESYYIENDASYEDLDCAPCDDTSPIFVEGLRVASDTITLLVEADQTSYCIAAIHFSLPASNEWQIATVSERSKGPSPANPPCA